MAQTRYTYRTLPPEWRDVSTWPKAELETLEPEVLARLERLQAGISLYLKDGSLKAACAGAACSADVLLNQLNRCVTLSIYGTVLGWPGLISGFRVKEYERHVPLPESATGAVTGTAGSFKKFLREQPELKATFDDLIIRGLGSGSVRSHKNFVVDLWKFFLRESKKLVSSDKYPLNSESGARRSVERYVKLFLDANTSALQPWVGRSATSAIQVGNGRYSFDLVERPFDLAGIDAHNIDCVGTIILDGPAGPQPVPITRIWIYAYIDFFSKSVLGYGVSIRPEPTATQIEIAVDMSLRPWKRRELKMAGDLYAEGAGFPCGSVAGLPACMPAAIRADNAMAGYSKLVTGRIRRKLGCAISYGAIGGWWQNYVVERIFGRIEKMGFQRSPSSTGKNASDPLQHNANAQAIKHRITWEELVDLIDVAFANYNADRQAGLGFRSSLEVLRDWLDPGDALMQVGLLPPPTIMTPNLGIAVETHPVRGGRSPGRFRAAYVQVDKCTYTNEVLAPRIDLVGQQLTLHIDEADLRTIDAFLPSGISIGELVVRERGWRRTKHSRDMRKTINRLRDDHELPNTSHDFMLTYMEHLEGKALEDVKKNPTRISDAASKLAEAILKTGHNWTGADRQRGTSGITQLPDRPIPSLVKRPSWS